MDSIVMINKVLGETSRIVDGIEPEQLDNPTPCEGWTVRDVLNHITGGADMFAIAASEGKVSDEQLGQLMVGDNLGDDYKASFERAVRPRQAGVRRPRRRRQDGQAALRRDARGHGGEHRDLRRDHAHLGPGQGNRPEHRPRSRGRSAPRYDAAQLMLSDDFRDARACSASRCRWPTTRRCRIAWPGSPAARRSALRRVRRRGCHRVASQRGRDRGVRDLARRRCSRRPRARDRRATAASHAARRERDRVGQRRVGERVRRRVRHRAGDVADRVVQDAVAHVHRIGVRRLVDVLDAAALVDRAVDDHRARSHRPHHRVGDDDRRAPAGHEHRADHEVGVGDRALDRERGCSPAS